MTDGLKQDKDNTQPFPDLAELVDKIDFDRKPISHGKTPANFHIGRWGALILELIAYPDDEEQILQDFGLTPTQFARLLGNPVFKQVYKDTESSIMALAGNGAYQLSARRLAERGIDVLESIMASGEDKDRLKAVEIAARLANLDPLVQAKTKEQTAVVNTGVQLVVNFSDKMPLPTSFNGQPITIETTAEHIENE